MFIRKKMLKKAISLIMTASILLNYNIYSVFAEKGNNFKASKAANHTVHNENCVENHSEEVVDKDFVVYDLLMKTGILANSSREASQHSKENSNDKSEIDDNIKENATKIVDSGAYDKTEMTDTIDKIDSNENIENASDKEAADIEKEIDKNITLDINGNKNSENSATFKDALDETTDDKDSFFIGYKITQGTQDSLLSDSIAEAELMYLATYMNKEYDDIEQSEVIYDVEDNPTYLAISFISGGYAIMIRSNLIVTEYSYNDKSPYSDSIGGKNYYLGVLNYYNGENITDMQNIMSGDRLSDDSIETFQKLNDEYNQVSPPVLLEEIYMDKELKEAVIHKTEYQRCIVHQVRNTLKYVSGKEHKPFATDLKTIYQAPTEERALEALERVTEKWAEKYPGSMKSWSQNWDAISPIFKFSANVRKVIYTTNAIESLNATYRKLNRQRSVFPSAGALLKALYLSTFEATKKWTMPIRNWGQVYGELSIMYEGRLLG